LITTDSFPTPDLARRTSEPIALATARAFATEQATMAQALTEKLHHQLAEVSAPRVRQAILQMLFVDVALWRWHLATAGWGRLGVGAPLTADRFHITIDQAGPNIDRLGEVGRLRPGATFDPATRTYQGGASTPAFEVVARYGDAARARFAAEGVTGDELHNLVTLPDGELVAGNRLVRGAAARSLADELADRLVRRGVDPGTVETGGDPLYVVTASSSARRTCHSAALRTLAEALPGDLRAWQTARYLHYQGIRRKKGTDAVTRVWLVAVGTWLLGRPPVLEQDCDLRCMVLGQAAALEHPADALFATDDRAVSAAGR